MNPSDERQCFNTGCAPVVIWGMVVCGFVIGVIVGMCV